MLEHGTDLQHHGNATAMITCPETERENNTKENVLLLTTYNLISSLVSMYNTVTRLLKEVICCQEKYIYSFVLSSLSVAVHVAIAVV